MEHEHGAFKVNRGITAPRDQDSTGRGIKNILFWIENASVGTLRRKIRMPEI
jgi:hypothetical protein